MVQVLSTLSTNICKGEGILTVLSLQHQGPYVLIGRSCSPYRKPLIVKHLLLSLRRFFPNHSTFLLPPPGTNDLSWVQFLQYSEITVPRLLLLSQVIIIVDRSSNNQDHVGPVTLSSGHNANHHYLLWCHYWSVHSVRGLASCTIFTDSKKKLQ